MQLKYSPKALEQLDEMFDYISQHSQNSAQNVKNTIHILVTHLEYFPYMGRAVSEGVRVLLSGTYPYKIYYHFTEKTGEIYILEIVHMKKGGE